MPISRDILIALGVAFIMVSGAFYVSAGTDTTEGEVSVATPAPERTYIEPKDSDGDGISDWAEELIKDRAVISDAIEPMEAYVPPETLTDRFSITFFQNYLISKGYNQDFESSKEALVDKSLRILKREAKDREYTIDDIIISNNDNLAAHTVYGNRMAEITYEYSEEMKLSEVDIVQRALAQKDPERLSQLDPIIRSYKNYLEQSLKTPVPMSLVREHLDVINVYSAIYNDLVAMQQMFDDPLLGLLRLKRYEQDSEALVYVYFNLDRALRRLGVTYEEDEPGNLYNYLGGLREIVQ